MKLIKLCVSTNSVDCKDLCTELGVSSEFFTVLRACQLFLCGKDDKADRLCRSAIKELQGGLQLRAVLGGPGIHTGVDSVDEPE